MRRRRGASCARPGSISGETLLGGRVRHAQAPSGFRSGIEPVLLAASVPARPGDCVIEAGCGAGTGLLCLTARVGAIRGVGIERDAAEVARARANAVANGMDALAFVVADVARAPVAAGVAHHAFANPPYHPLSVAPPSADDRRRVAKSATEETLSVWVGAMARATRPGGTVTLALPAASTPSAIDAFRSAGIGSATLWPLWPRATRPAKLMLIQGRVGGRGPFRIGPGLVLHGNGQTYTDAAEAILRRGAALPLG
jgi:tRNA1Val (adenine37-N6)-methyltransferase